ncbi:MAG TPA: hypothetical protein VJS43_04525 [Candidatus Acidoferrales bacterium]|nr:hypothetical protein [Candidatus Acidoferrales bacterium]
MSNPALRVIRSQNTITKSFLLLAAVLLWTLAVRADAPFDLIGPKLEMTVTRAGKTLPISSVPNLQVGDRLWIQTDLPKDQSVRYVLIVAFLQGPTNPPPDNWFTRIETWSKQSREEGSVITIPKNAQQALLFLAPATGGDMPTLRSTVRGRPGMFVRASEDLNQASLDRTRVDKYLAEVRETSLTDPTALESRTKLLAQTLHLKVNQDCFDRPADQQASCLTQNTENLVLDDSHSNSIVAALTSGAPSDLIGSVTATPVISAEYYSAYVGTVMDVARLLGSLHTAEYQYIPAVTLPHDDELNLRLNSPPSFHNPKSVLVVGLPAIEAAQLPPLRPADAKQIFCLEKAPLVLPILGAPLVYSTAIAHDFVLRLQGKTGSAITLPATPDAASGGFVIDTKALKAANLPDAVTGSLRGSWGFDTYDGPAFKFQNPQTAKWTIPPADAAALVVGRQDTIHAKQGCAECVQEVSALDPAGKKLAVTWKVDDPAQIEMNVPLKDEPAAPLTLKIKQYGAADPDALTVHTYAEAARLDRFAINAGDYQGVLTGARLDEVSGLELNGMHFAPAKLSRSNQEDVLTLTAPDNASVAALQADAKQDAHVQLKDGRTLNLQTTVEAPRPKLTLVSKNVQVGDVPGSIHLGASDELPQNGRLSFFVKSEVPQAFPRTEKIEVATVDGSFDVLLGTADGGLVLQDASSVLAVLDPQKAFGASAFGPLQFRPVADDGSKGDWQPLAHLVRIPTLNEVHCPAAPDQQCTLGGANLFLLDSVASDPEFKNIVPVPAGYMNAALSVPRPYGTLLYIKLRDDPSTVDVVALPVLPDAQ